ncbi:MAG: MFS transporter [Planctomycetaceae bacterium]|nr:MFS transporter [Planctomycetaceae bacterium]
MAKLNIAGSFFRGPCLEGNAARTFRLHLVYALLDATAGGILLNAPLIAIKSFQAANWQLPLRELFSGLGMILALYLGSRMASRPKMPFVFIPGVAAGICSLAMATATGSAFWFLTLLGVGALFEVVTRPAITAVLRNNYPVEQRGHATGEVRKWSSLFFLTSSIVSALILHFASKFAGAAAQAEAANRVLQWCAGHMPQILMVLAGLLSLGSFVCFRQIRVEESLDSECRDLRPEIGSSFREAMAVLVHDARYRRYLFGCFLDGFFQMLYFPMIWILLSRDLGFGYFGCTTLMHALPALAAFVATGWLGRLFDRTNPWISWAGVRFAWGLDALLLAATPLLVPVFPPALILLPVLGRILRGSVQGGWWILWWQIGVTHFSPPGGDTSRYMGIMVFLNGIIRFSASAAGMTLAAMAVSPQTLLVIGGVGVILSGVYSLWQAARERRHHQPETIAEFERQFAGTLPE